MAKSTAKKLVLVGMMGSGKTTVAKRLAYLLNLTNYDSDHEIEKSANMSISEIFEKFGEQHFRQVERKTIKNIILKDTDFVLAVGGGAFANEQTRNVIKTNATSIWLDASFVILCNRLLKNKKSRPLLNNENWRINLKQLLHKRIHYYKMSDLKVCVDNMNVNEVVEKIVCSINNRLKYVKE